MFHTVLLIIEGSYSCHPTLQKQYNMKIFLSVEPEEQINRIKKRNGEKAVNAFRQKWIPLEELYFSTYNIKQNCDLYYRHACYTLLFYLLQFFSN